MADIENLERGTQILYVPGHVSEPDPDNPQVEQGFVTSRTDEIVWCRFFLRDSRRPNYLRTRSNSEACNPADLVVRDTRQQEIVDNWLERIDQETEEFLDGLGCPRDCRTAWPACEEENCDER